MYVRVMCVYAGRGLQVLATATATGGIDLSLMPRLLWAVDEANTVYYVEVYSVHVVPSIAELAQTYSRPADAWFVMYGDETKMSCKVL